MAAQGMAPSPHQPITEACYSNLGVAMGVGMTALLQALPPCFPASLVLLGSQFCRGISSGRRAGSCLGTRNRAMPRV